MLDVVDTADRAANGAKPATPRLSVKHFSTVDQERYYLERPLAQFQELVDYVARFFLDRFIADHYVAPLFANNEPYRLEYRQFLDNAIQVARAYWLNANSRYAFESLLPLMDAHHRRLTCREQLAYMVKITAIISDDFDSMLSQLADLAYKREVETKEDNLGCMDAVIPILHPEAFARGYACSARYDDYIQREIRTFKCQILERKARIQQSPEVASELENQIAVLESNVNFYEEQTKQPSLRKWLREYPDQLISGDLTL